MHSHFILGMLTICLAASRLFAVAQEDSSSASLAAGHPRPSYDLVADIDAMADAVRKSAPPMQRGAWEWDRLLTRYVDGGRRSDNELRILHAYFLSILDRNGGGGRYDTFFTGHGAWGSGGRLRIYHELVRQNLLTAAEQIKFREIVSRALQESFDYRNSERSANNRPFGMNGGPAIALQIFPDLPQALTHRRWLHAQWRELREYGDTTETNYFPYGPIYLDGLIDLATGLGKFETERGFLHTHTGRYLDYVHGGGVRGNPNSGSWVRSAPERGWKDPWNAAYYQGSGNDAHVWYRLAKEFRSPHFLWASEQSAFGGRPPRGQAIPREYLAACRARYAWFHEQNIQPEPPPGGAKIGYYSPTVHRVPERMYLCPDREAGSPFASFYLYDRNNNYMHYNDDVMGQLYEYAVDGAKLLHTSGKYNSNAMKLPAAYDGLWVQHPAVDFVMGRAAEIPFGTWNTASMPLAGLLNSRAGPDSPSWFYDETINLFRRRDEPEFGYAHGNMDGYWYLNNQFRLSSIQLELIDPLVEVRIPHLAGSRGNRPLLKSWNDRAVTVSLVRKEHTEVVWTGGAPSNRFVTVNTTADTIRLAAREGTTLSVRIETPDIMFDAVEDYTRLLIAHNGRIKSPNGAFGARGGHRSGFMLNDRMDYLTWDARGGILDRQALKAENRGRDSFGQFRFTSYFGPNGKWTRQTVLTEEGYLIVRDHYQPDATTAGYHAGPCWLLRPDEGWNDDDANDRGPQPHDRRKNWLDAPAWDHAWWQKQKKRLLVWLHPGPGQSFGVTAHATSPDISRPLGHEYFPTLNFHAKAILKYEEPQVFFSVLVPFDDGQSAMVCAKSISTAVDDKGTCTARIGSVSVSITSNGQWTVKR